MKLIELRKKNKLRQEDLAKYLCIAPSTYQHYENNRTEPNIETLKALADFYNVSIDYIVGRERIGDIGYLDSEQILLVKIIKELNRDNLLILTGRAISMLESQQA